MAIETIIVGQLNTNGYIFYNKESREAGIIDPGDEGEFFINKIKDLGLKPQLILATHGHFDHVLAATELKLAYQIPFYLNAKDIKILKRTQKTAKFFTGLEVDPPPSPDGFLVQGKIIKIGKLKLQVLATPGHTPGSVSFWSKKEKIIFGGDLLFAQGTYGRTDLFGGDYQKLQQSIKKVLCLPLETIIYPGHGERTRVEEERKYYSSLLKLKFSKIENLVKKDLVK